MKLKILTFNIWDIPFWFCVNRERRIARLPDFIKKHDPDIICLQESFDTKNRALTHSVIGRAIYKAHHEEHKNRRILIYKKFDITGGLAIFSKFRIKKTVFTPHKNPFFMSIPEKLARKGFLETLLETPLGPLLVINVHFINGKSNLPKRVRAAQINMLLERLKNVKITTILAGDFNDEVRDLEENFHKVFQKLGFSECALFVKKKQKPTLRIENPYTTIFFNIRAGGISERYDHVLFKNVLPTGRQGNSLKLEVKDVRTLTQPRNPLSDHEPVMAIFTVI